MRGKSLMCLEVGFCLLRVIFFVRIMVCREMLQGACLIPICGVFDFGFLHSVLIHQKVKKLPWEWDGEQNFRQD